MNCLVGDLHSPGAYVIYLFIYLLISSFIYLLTTQPILVIKYINPSRPHKSLRTISSDHLQSSGSMPVFPSTEDLVEMFSSASGFPVM